MTSEDLIEVLAERPFVPLRFRLADGRNYDIRHPEMAIVTPTLVALGISSRENGPLADRVRVISIAHIVEVEPVELSEN